jgi:hypothetical protein
VLKLAARKGRLAITPAAAEEIVLSNMQLWDEATSSG